MIVFLNSSDIDYEKWDDCISNSINSLPYAFSWYLDAIHDNWCALVEDDYKSVMPVTWSSKYGINYFYQPYFAQQLGVFSSKPLSEPLITEFIEAIPDKIKVIDFNLNHFNSFKGVGYNIISNTNYLLDLIGDYEKIKKLYSSNTKRNLKKAKKNELTALPNIKPDDIINLFKDNKGREVLNWKDEHYKTITRLMYIMMSKGIGKPYGVYSKENQLIAAAYFIITENRLIFLFSGTNHEGKDSGAMTFLIDEVVKRYSPSKRILDFEGSNDPGLARFYSGFGAVKSSYVRVKKVKGSFLFRVMLRILRK